MVEPYLHGISDYDLPQTTVAWREEVELLTPKILDHNKLDAEDVLDLFPLKPQEELSEPTYGTNKVFEQLEKIAARDAMRGPAKQLSAWVIDRDGSVKAYSLQQLVEKDNKNKPRVRLGGRTVVLPPHAGGVSGGLLVGDEPYAATIDYDVSDEWYADAAKLVKRRTRVWDEDEKPKPMRLIRRIDIPADGEDEDVEDSSWFWLTRPSSADDDGSKSAREPITWQHHTTDVGNGAKALADKLLQAHPDLHQALCLAAKFHDLGKMRIVWQRSIGNPHPCVPYAKSGKGWRPIEITDYRHEFGSLLDVLKHPEFLALNHRPDVQDLILHLIAVHHGNGRPHFPKPFDPERPEQSSAEVACITFPPPNRIASRAPHLRFVHQLPAGVSNLSRGDLWHGAIPVTSGRGVSLRLALRTRHSVTHLLELRLEKAVLGLASGTGANRIHETTHVSLFAGTTTRCSGRQPRVGAVCRSNKPLTCARPAFG